MNLSKILKKKRNGFTLIELIVVVTIIGILMLIAVPRFTSMTDGANQKAFESNHRIVSSAVSMYIAANNGAKPKADADLDPYITSSDSSSTGATALAKLQNKPDGATYVLGADGSVTSTYTKAKGKDGKDTTKTLKYEP